MAINKTTKTREVRTRSSNDQGSGAASRTKKGFWAKFTDRLKDTHCTMTPPECR